MQHSTGTLLEVRWNLSGDFVVLVFLHPLPMRLLILARWKFQPGVKRSSCPVSSVPFRSGPGPGENVLVNIHPIVCLAHGVEHRRFRFQTPRFEIFLTNFNVFPFRRYARTPPDKPIGGSRLTRGGHRILNRKMTKLRFLPADLIHNDDIE